MAENETCPKCGAAKETDTTRIEQYVCGTYMGRGDWVEGDDCLRRQLAAEQAAHAETKAKLAEAESERDLSGEAIGLARAHLKEHMGEQCSCAFFDDCVHNAVAMYLQVKEHLAQAQAACAAAIERSCETCKHAGSAPSNRVCENCAPASHSPEWTPKDNPGKAILAERDEALAACADWQGIAEKLGITYTVADDGYGVYPTGSVCNLCSQVNGKHEPTCTLSKANPGQAFLDRLELHKERVRSLLRVIRGADVHYGDELDADCNTVTLACEEIRSLRAQVDAYRPGGRRDKV